ncbi:MAG: DUF1566 domain-containing protein [Bacteroidales bacterium]|nr:DUF1566 domain-containing protein [Bacteroidales bacterium]MDD4383960.1 DUF1566 domain-containing protein [Bacteroidales bacterium]MDY0196365.1 DUF1566 domain-containing protein [Tenuifilaceae bacterium]
MKKIFIAFTIAATIFTACEKETDQEPQPELPTVSSEPITNITTTSAESGGNITSKGSADIIEKGIVWSTTSNPMYGASNTYMTNDGDGIGVYSSTMTDLIPGTTYYVKAYARNKVGTAYGTELSFTSGGLTLPTLTTGPITSITNSSAVCAGMITSDGGTEITARGICWSIEPNPTILDATIYSGTGSGGFEGLVTGTSNTLYYVRAFATNSVGTAYGNELSFTTLLGIGDNYQGGVIAYVLQSDDPGYDANVQHGLIAALSDQSTSAPWSLTFTTTGATAQAYGTGQANTNTIVTDQGEGSYAAKLCDDLVLEGYEDWYLPSMYELEKLFLNKDVIGGFAVAFYWSSSEEDMNSAWLQSFNSNSQAPGTKTNTYYVRAVRSF